MSRPVLSRRGFLLASGAMGAAAGACAQAPAQERRRVLRIAHLTDIHMQNTGEARRGLTRALAHAQSRPEPPAFLVNGGDAIMDALETPKDFCLKEWELFREVLEAECSLPIYHVLGNHDVFGWGLTGSDRDAAMADPLYGKAMALQELGLESPYYSFEEAGWHFVVLDSTHPREIESPQPYTGKLDEEQFAWLVEDLEATPATRPVCLISHIPILCACEFFDGDLATTGNWVVPGAWMHIDAGRLRGLLLAHPNVRACLSGHAHQHDQVDYLGVRYSCNGAVSGNWWHGDYLNCPPSYVMIDFYEDGSIETELIAYDEV